MKLERVILEPWRLTLELLKHILNHLWFILEMWRVYL
jgi:hypothetical protein